MWPAPRAPQPKLTGGRDPDRRQCIDRWNAGQAFRRNRKDRSEPGKLGHERRDPRRFRLRLGARFRLELGLRRGQRAGARSTLFWGYE